MTLNEVMDRVTEIFKEVLEEDDIILKRETVSGDIDEWDSLNNIQIVVEIETSFDIKFTTTEIESFENVGAMCENILQKIS
jgi:acyl carrier protein